jgi:mannose/fructose/N-acetylgalactosamine-specific phosphotransferase system component IIB
MVQCRASLQEKFVIVLSRIDSRLIHGQVIEAWLPHLVVKRVVVADDLAAGDPLTQAAFELAVPPDVELVTTRVAQADFPRFARDGVRTLLLFRTVHDAVVARAHGLPDGPLNLGNIHAAPGKVAVSRSVFLDSVETAALGDLKASGMQVTIQAVPAEAAVPFPS